MPTPTDGLADGGLHHHPSAASADPVQHHDGQQYPERDRDNGLLHRPAESAGYHIASGFTPVTFKNLEPGLQYQVVAYWAGNYYFRHFSDGDLNRYELVTFNSTGAKTDHSRRGLRVRPSLSCGDPQHNRRVPERHPNRHHLQQHGLYPAHSRNVADGHASRRGRPVYWFLHRREPPPVCALRWRDLHGPDDAVIRGLIFAHWNDTGSTNATRAVTLSKSATTLIAVYDVTKMAPAMQAGAWSHAIPSVLAPFDLYLIAIPFVSAEAPDPGLVGHRTWRERVRQRGSPGANHNDHRPLRTGECAEFKSRFSKNTLREAWEESDVQYVKRVPRRTRGMCSPAVKAQKLYHALLDFCLLTVA